MAVNFERGLIKVPNLPAPTAKPSGKAETGGFAEALGRVESSAKAADQASEDLVTGKIDLHEALVQMEKADLMLRLGTNVRNKLLDAYQKLMNSGNG